MTADRRPPTAAKMNLKAVGRRWSAVEAKVILLV
jgi:hypothetical protein